MIDEKILKMAFYAVDRAVKRQDSSKLAAKAILIELGGRGGFKSVIGDICSNEDSREIINEIESVIAAIIDRCEELTDTCSECFEQKLSCKCEKED